MSMDYLSSQLKSRMQLTTKTVGADRIRRAKENNEDVAVLSMFLPGSAAKEENSRFRCALGVDCRLGDWRLATPGNVTSKNWTVTWLTMLAFAQWEDLRREKETIIECDWVMTSSSPITIPSSAYRVAVWPLKLIFSKFNGVIANVNRQFNVFLVCCSDVCLCQPMN